VAIQSFADKDAEAFFLDRTVRKRVGWANIREIARRKLDMMHYAINLRDLQSPPGNRLEALKQDLDGYYSIRINDQWRILFRWTDAGPAEVAIVDYHRG
jgi:proteic killer suppression protein